MDQQITRLLTDISIENFQTNTEIYYTGCILDREKMLWTIGDYYFRKLVIDETGYIDHDHYDQRF
jgi:hypothetical protein